jgi:hypothetical protein
VAKIAYKTDKSGKNQIADFTGHNVSIESYIDENGLEQDRVVFDTQAFGTIVSAAIENVDGQEAIVVVANVWKRYYTATEIIERRIKDGNLHTSWEISVIDYEKKIIGGKLIKVINKGIFSADTMLGTAYPPAFPAAKILDVASDENDSELCDALIQDTMSLNENPQGNEVEKMDEENKVETSVEEEHAGGVENGEEKGEEASSSNEEAGTAEGKEEKIDPVSELVAKSVIDPAVETNPLQAQLDEAHAKIEKLLNDLDEKNTALISAQNQINDLGKQIESLAPYKEAAQKAEAEKAEAQRQEAIAELRKYAEKSGMVSKEELESGEIADLISNLKETEVKVVIADRIVAKSKKESTETAEKKQPKVRMNIPDAPPADSISIFKAYLHG